jgi:hypothetical protein
MSSSQSRAGSTNVLFGSGQSLRITINPQHHSSPIEDTDGVSAGSDGGVDVAAIRLDG